LKGVLALLSIGYGFMIGVFVSLIGGGGASLYLGVLTSQLGLATAVAVPTSLFVALPALFLGFLTQVRIHNVNFKWWARLSGQLGHRLSCID
jgi:uncharacterized membrane protein YfcA